MRATGNAIRAIKPTLVRVRRGWLAISETGSPLNVAVQAETEEAARDRFDKELSAWAQLAESDTKVNS